MRGPGRACLSSDPNHEPASEPTQDLRYNRRASGRGGLSYPPMCQLPSSPYDYEYEYAQYHPHARELRLDLSELRSPHAQAQVYHSFGALPTADSMHSVVPWAPYQMPHQDMYSPPPFGLGDPSPFYPTSSASPSVAGWSPNAGGDVDVFDVTFALDLASPHAHSPPALVPDSTASPGTVSEGSVLDTPPPVVPVGPHARGHQAPAPAFGYFDVYRYPAAKQQMPAPRASVRRGSGSASNESASGSAHTGSQRPANTDANARKPAVSAPGSSGGSGSGGPHRRRFPCQHPGCGRRFTSQYTLRVHTDAHRPRARPSFPCRYGPLDVDSSDHPAAAGSCSAPSGAPHPGGTCLERFSRAHDRLRHEVAKHGRICEFVCPERGCGRFFSSGRTLGNHRCAVARTRWVE